MCNALPSIEVNIYDENIYLISLNLININIMFSPKKVIQHKRMIDTRLLSQTSIE